MAAGKNCTVRVQAQFDQILATKRLATADEIEKVGFKPGDHIYVCDKANHEFVINVDTGEVAHIHSLNGYGPGAYALRDEWSQIKFVVDPTDPKIQGICQHVLVCMATRLKPGDVVLGMSFNHTDGDMYNNLDIECVSIGDNNLHANLMKVIAKNHPRCVVACTGRRYGKEQTRPIMKKPITAKNLTQKIEILESLYLHIPNKAKRRKLALELYADFCACYINGVSVTLAPEQKAAFIEMAALAK